jgi:hypothetical protein
MTTLAAFWLPILLSAVFVFVASSVIHMALPIHKGDFKKLPGEEGVLASMREQGLQPGCYMFPCAGSMKEMASPEMIEKCKRGPVGFMTVLPSGAPAMGRSLVQWFVFCLVVGYCVAFASSIGLGRGASSEAIFKVTGAAALLGYGFTNVTDSIWKGVSWVITGKFLFDGIVYALVTAGTFVWLWPAAGA